jgi:hypothetical protein
MAFKKAERRQAYLKLALTGPSGAGKTMSALLIASGMGKKIALMDTENKSASLYATEFDFDTSEIDPPYTVEKYTLAIDDAVRGGYDVLVIDSLTHVWKGTGGLLEQKEALDARGRGNSYTNWASITKAHNTLIAKILNSDIHIIATMRSKQDYILVDKDGKQVPKKVGMAPEQRDGMEYEFTAVLDMAMNHSAEASKDRTRLFDGKVFTPSKKTGEELMAWLQSGKPMEKPVANPAVELLPKEEISSELAARRADEGLGVKAIKAVTEKQLFRLHAIRKSAGYDEDEVRGWIHKKYGIDRDEDLKRHQYDEICNYMLNNKKDQPSMN